MIAAAQVRVALQCGVRLQQSPGRVIRLRPVLSENAAANLARLRQVVQTPLHRDADVSSRAGRSVTVDQFQERAFLLAGKGKFPFEALQGLVDLWHVGLEVDGFDGAPRDLPFDPEFPSYANAKKAGPRRDRLLSRKPDPPLVHGEDQVVVIVIGTRATRRRASLVTEVRPDSL